MPDVANRLNIIFVSKGVHGTAAIEGNTLTQEQVAARLQQELDLPPSQEYLGVEIDNLSRGYDRVEQCIHAEEIPPLTEAEISNYNRINF